MYKNIGTAMVFEWDERKNRRNRAKHGVSFEAATLVFDDPHSVTVADQAGEGELEDRGSVRRSSAAPRGAHPS